MKEWQISLLIAAVGVSSNVLYSKQKFLHSFYKVLHVKQIKSNYKPVCQEWKPSTFYESK